MICFRKSSKKVFYSILSFHKSKGDPQCREFPNNNLYNCNNSSQRWKPSRTFYIIPISRSLKSKFFHFRFLQPINSWLWNNFCWIMLPSVVWGRKFIILVLIILILSELREKKGPVGCRRVIGQVFDFSRQSTPIFFVKPIFKKNYIKSYFRFRHFNFFPSNCLLEFFLAISIIWFYLYCESAKNWCIQKNYSY